MGVDHRVGKAGADREIRFRETLTQDKARADLAARFLVVGHMQLDRALQRSSHRCERLHGESIRRDIAFGDRDAASDHPAIDDIGRVGIVGPALAGRHHVAMRVERDHQARPKTLANDQVGGARHAGPGEIGSRDGVALHDETELLEQRGGATGMRVAVARRIVGRHAHEFGEHRDLRRRLFIEVRRHGIRGGRRGNVGHAGPCAIRALRLPAGEPPSEARRCARPDQAPRHARPRACARAGFRRLAEWQPCQGLSPR